MESMTDSCEIMFSVDEWLKTVEMKKFVEHGMFLHMKITYHMSQEEYFYYTNKWWLDPNKSGNDTLQWRTLSDFKQALSTLERLHQEPGGDQLEPTPYWKYQQWRSASSSSSNLVAMKVKKEEASKGLWSNGATRCLQNFGENPQKVAFKNSFYFVTDRSFTADGGLL